ncbi:putative dimethyl sulfoxide reductase [Magnetospirillum sp. XM-1]|uniref:molybdopterin oxidoreductase family protein n=1 Tax=Magnetospirillum sp. XM-1 TaxID=1663591 RepID=UPI00073DCB6C|nr:molybdopterin oxidoreductase family protein [Magnetospirillum sp. XM-1]CUW37969.1 putative dimethyl sulfoxide reductase [Magnetospirillum sp. XM-1]
MTEFLPSVCPHDCPSTCALDVERLDPRTIGRVRGSARNTYTDGVICAKVARYAQRVHHPDRLTTPLRRIGAKGEGRFEPISWDDALHSVADAFSSAAAQFGEESVWPYYYAGTMGLVQRDGINRLRHVLGYSGEKTTICNYLADMGWLAGAGVKHGLDPREMAEADLVILWGSNAVHTQINAISWANRARRARQAPLVVVDCYRTPTAEAADIHLMPRPGTDGALATAVMHVLLRDGHADRDYMATHTDFSRELEAHLASRSPHWAEAITGIPACEIESFARLYGTTPRSFLRLGYGFTRSRNGAAAMHAASCLPAMTGAWRHLGGGALYSNAAIYHLDTTVIEGTDCRKASVRMLDQTRIGPILTGDRGDLGDGPPVAAMLVQNTNPAVVAPDSNLVRRGLARDDLFLCVHEQFMTETARFADIVLPATTFLEHDDLYRGGGHTYLGVARALIEPHGQSRSNHEVICALAELLEADHPGFHMTAWELVDTTLRRSGWPGADEVLAAGGHDCALDFPTAHFATGFGHKDGRFHFSPDWAALGADHTKLPTFPDHCTVIEAADADHPFRLVTPPARSFLNTTFTETPAGRAAEGRPTALVHPKDCQQLGLEEGMLVRLGNARGEVLATLRPFDGLRPGVVVVEGLWPNADFSGGLGINHLTSADPGMPGGGGVFHDTAIWLQPA